MASSSASKYFEIPKYFVFGEKGIFSGSASERDFNYKVIPVCPKEGDKCLKAYIWSGELSIDNSEDVAEKVFPLSEEGHAEMLRWLEGEYLARPDRDTPAQSRRKYAKRLTELYVDMDDYERNPERIKGGE